MRRTGLSLRIPRLRRNREKSNSSSSAQETPSTLGYPEETFNTPLVVGPLPSPLPRTSHPSPHTQVAHEQQLDHDTANLGRYRQSYLDRPLPPRPLRWNRAPHTPTESATSVTTAYPTDGSTTAYEDEPQSSPDTFYSESVSSLVSWTRERINHLLTHLHDPTYSLEEKLEVVRDIADLYTTLQVIRKFSDWFDE